jgi:outer membrane murein-binding lipoprotein Lpp
MNRYAVLALFAVALLSSCGDSASDRLEVADVNARRAIAKADELSSRVSDLETRVEELESKLGL